MTTYHLEHHLLGIRVKRTDHNGVSYYLSSGRNKFDAVPYFKREERALNAIQRREKGKIEGQDYVVLR